MFLKCLLILFCTLFSLIGADAPTCRFALKYTTDEISSCGSCRTQFIQDVMFWEGHFHQPGVGYHAATGLTYDGHGINYTTGELADPLHYWSAASKESIHLMMLAKALDGDSNAKVFINYNNPDKAESTALEILQAKIKSYQLFNTTYPGFGGYLPWYYITSSGVIPANGWENRVPSLDNGEMIWAIYAIIQVLQSNLQQYTLTQMSDKINLYQTLLSDYQDYFKMLAQNAKIMFYHGNGLIRAVVSIKNVSEPPSPDNYADDCECWLNDPYEGELFAFFLDLYASGFTDQEKESIWVNKRGLLQAAHYDTPKGPVVVQRGWWFSSHEQWKYLELPYVEVPINNLIFMNGEKIRTWNSRLKNIPGLFASVTNVTTRNGEDTGYISALGIPEIAFQPAVSQEVITPYGSFPIIYANQPVGLAWYHSMLVGPKMQGPYGSTESVNVEGTEIAPVLTWDSKITTVVSIVGGVSDIVSKGLKTDMKFNRFYEIVDREWRLVFEDLINNSTKIDFVLPSLKIPSNLPDFTQCSASFQ
eukprot:TRINITY_DN11268_c0_g1_i1.p1 TRINITY_DN11268_c0_g1~~TRINITY_DN11268_c0_g1_i1.p1  ORF type:complete len:532 (+),score=71.97 TRINITY_DN11268_c0_g1_i1:51-1646(+)